MECQGDPESEASKQWNSRLSEGTTVIVFNEPSIYIYHFPNFVRSVEPCHWQVTTLSNKFEPVAFHLEFSFIQFIKPFLFLMVAFETNFFLQKFFFHVFLEKHK